MCQVVLPLVCGVAVARGLVPLAIGSDTGGSIRIPASFNGVVGYKGSSGSFPMQGVFHLSESLDTLGPIAADVESCIGVAELLNGRDVKTVDGPCLSELEILVPTNIVFENVQDDVAKNFDESLSRLAKQGVRISKQEVPEFSQISALLKHGSIAGAEALELHWDIINSEEASQIDPRILSRLLESKSMTAVDLVVLQKARKRLIQSARLGIGNRVIAFPTTATVAPLIEDLEQDDEVYVNSNRLTLRNTSLGNILDWCGVSLPNGVDSQGMPTGLLLSMPGGRDRFLLATANVIEPYLIH